MSWDGFRLLLYLLNYFLKIRDTTSSIFTVYQLKVLISKYFNLLGVLINSSKLRLIKVSAQYLKEKKNPFKAVSVSIWLYTKDLSSKRNRKIDFWRLLRI